MTSITAPRVPTAADGHERRLVAGQLAIRADADDAGWGPLRFEGHAAVFGRPSQPLADAWGSTFQEIIEPGAFADVLNNDVRLLINHDPSLVLARTSSGTLQLAEDDIGLLVRADLAPVSYARDLAVILERGDVSQMSFAFTVGEDGQTWEQAPDGSWIRRVTRVARLYDVSIVTYPAYVDTDAALRAIKAAGTMTPADLRRLADELEAGTYQPCPRPDDQALRREQQALRHRALAARYATR